jgi:Holliday junction resolvasome RuvABC endonuclease subunit
MSLLALDLGTTTGWALQGKPLLSGTWNLKPRRFDGGGMRFVRFESQLAEMHKLKRITRVAYEEVRMHRGVDAAHIYGGLQAVLTAWCEGQKIPYEAIHYAHIKRHMTGKGNANKEAMLAAVRAKGFAPVDDNEADAIALLLCVMDEKAAA